MKLTRLDLIAYGPFTNLSLEFPADGPGLHLIHGPNEAGKTSALRGLRCFFFKFPNSLDNHKHEYPDMRVGATLVDASGATLSAIRRKAKVKTLRGPDDETLVDDRVLDTFLGGQSESRFCSVFMSNLDELIKGGTDLINGKGDFGEILFGASGLSRLPEVRKVLETDAELLFKAGAGAKNPRINAALLSLDATRKDSDLAMLPSADWAATDRDHKEALAKLRSVRTELNRFEAEHRRLERLVAILPKLADRREAMSQLETIGTVPNLDAGFTERRLSAIATRAANAESAQLASTAIAGIETEIAAISVPERLLIESDTIGELREELGGIRKARGRRPKLVEQAAQADSLARTTLRDLAPGMKLEDVESLRLSKAQKTAIQNLDRQREVIEATTTKARDEVLSLTAKVAGRSLSSSLDTIRHLETLNSLLAGIGPKGDPQARYDTAMVELQRLETESTLALSRLPRWSGTLDELAARPVPADATVADLDHAMLKAVTAIEAADQAIRANAAEIATLDEQAAQARVGGDPPTEANLAQSRTVRDQGWHEVRLAWIEGQNLRPAPELALSYEHLVKSSDSLADALRREADRVATHTAREARRNRLIDAAEGLKQVRSEAESAVEQTRSDWSAAWFAAGVKPGSPAEMRAWLASYRDLLTSAIKIRAARSDVQTQSHDIHIFRSELDSTLQALGEPPAASSERPASLVARARAVIERGELVRSLDAAKALLEAAETRANEWKSRWADGVRPLGLGPEDATQVALDMIERLEGLFKNLEDVTRKRSEIDEIDAESSRFEATVMEIAQRVGLDSLGELPEALTERLVTALAEAESEKTRHETALTRLKAEQKRLTAAEAMVRAQDSLLAAFCREAGCDHVDQLPETEQRSNEARRWRDRVIEDDRQILAFGAGATLDEIARDATNVDAYSLPDQLHDLEEQIAALQTQTGELNQEVGRLQERLNAMDGGATASDANEKARQWLAKIEADVEQYARLKLASAMLRKAIDRYRDRHQGPILNRLGGLFAGLTAGSFANVVLEDDESNATNPGILKGVRSGQPPKTVPVDGMSQGTADALYLAVRLATLETYLDAHEPMPFIVDDILVHFDDARAAAALMALLELSQRTQVLFFTHHRHLIDLAEKALPKQSWQLHELPGRTGLEEPNKATKNEGKRRKTDLGLTVSGRRLE